MSGAWLEVQAVSSTDVLKHHEMQTQTALQKMFSDLFQLFVTASTVYGSWRDASLSAIRWLATRCHSDICRIWIPIAGTAVKVVFFLNFILSFKDKTQYVISNTTWYVHSCLQISGGFADISPSMMWRCMSKTVVTWLGTSLWKISLFTHSRSQFHTSHKCDWQCML